SRRSQKPLGFSMFASVATPDGPKYAPAMLSRRVTPEVPDRCMPRTTSCIGTNLLSLVVRGAADQPSAAGADPSGVVRLTLPSDGRTQKLIFPDSIALSITYA